ncbi:alternative oxidase [Zychaea mexicana]|uniref:alternative oxidase n=1 Tax=Zychaea mexicana TaxID=64656 RepID=UPI0022FF2AF1|nr:alternative oxidase [Zychaea mexicana]KAI9498800.1 alternative oxidase [Zychaea mexicana]
MRREFFGDQHKLSRENLKKVDVGVTNHYEPQGLSDRFAYRLVRTLRLLPDTYFRNDHYTRVVMLETIAAVPGMIGAMLRHMLALRKLKTNQGSWIIHLLHEAENERMHLMIWLKLLQPSWYNRWLILIAQGVFFNGYFWLYLWSPRTAHRMCGYLEEEAIHSYNEFIETLEKGALDNPQAPKMAIEYYNLVPNATVLDVALCVRADEAVHRDCNHYFSTCIAQNLPIVPEGNSE